MIDWTGEAEPGRPYWWEDVPAAPDLPDAPPARTDVLIIGAGYTGLSAALVAADAGASVTVIDAGHPGQGASSRNGGMFGAHPRLSWPVLAKAFGADTADALFAEAAPAMAFVRDLIDREGIACDYRQTGRIQMAWTAPQFAAQARLAQTVRAKSEVEIHLVDRDGLAREITTERYFGGLLFPQHGGLHPARFHAGLLAAVLARGVTVVEACPVLGLERQGAGFRARTPRGTVSADRVLLATNGYTPPQFRWHQRRVFPLPSFLIATEPLPSNLLGHLAPGRRMMVETRARHSYFRISPDGTRILYGGRASMRPIPPAEAARRLRATMLEVWPDLKGTRLSHVWSGNTGYSFSHMPNVGEVDGVHYAMGYSGSGTVMAPYLGAKAAYRMLGDPRGETAYARTPLKTSWMHRFDAPHFLRAADLWYRTVVDWRDRLGGR